MTINFSSALKLTALLSFFLFSSSVASGQIALRLSSGSSAPGAAVTLNLSLAATGTRPAALQWTFTLQEAAFTAITAARGPSAISASKNLSCNVVNGTYICALYGVNNTTIPDGVVATVTLTLSSSTSSRTVGVTNVVSSTSVGSSLVTSATGGAVTVQAGGGSPVLSRLSCATTSITGSGTSTCTVVLSKAAPTGGAVVALSDNSSYVTLPASVTVPAGASTANFTASITRVSTDSAAVLSASLNGTTANASLSLIALAVPSTLSCSPSTLRPSSNGTCTITLNKAAPSGGLPIAISDNSAALTVPASVTVAAGSTTATFAASAGTASATTTVIVSVAANSASLSTTVIISTTTAPQVSTLACSPTSLSSGASTTCTVTLSSAAPTGGTLVTLSDNNASLTVPASVTVAAGATSGRFVATAGTVTSAQTVSVVAASNGTSKTVSINLTLPSPLTWILCVPESLASKATATCTVALNAIATQNLSIALTDNSTLLTTPASVVVPISASKATFQITAGTITSAQTAVVTATLNGVSKTTSVSLVTSTTSCPCSLWKTTALPTVITERDTTPTELGMKFRSNVGGYILGVRFYKGPQNTGTHTGKLWSKGGTLLASVTFKNETASGWQQANFSTPVAVAANTTYIVSYWSPASHYSIDSRYFQSAGVTSGPLYALRDGEDGGNGLYRYSTSAFPTTTWASSNYWVDVVFNTIPSATPAAAPAITNTLLTSRATAEQEDSVTRSATVDEVAATPANSLHCAPKAVQAGDSFTCQLQLPTDARPSILPVAAGNSEVRLPATVRARPHQNLITFRGTVDKGASQSSFVVSVGDGDDAVEDQITVLPSSAPILSLPAAQSVKAGEPVSFQVSAQDPAGLPVQLSASNLPNGASFQQDSGRFEWSPALHQQGDHTLTFTAVNANGESSESQTQVLVDSGNPVMAKVAPGLCSPGAVATLEGRQLSPGAETFADPTGSSLELSGTRVVVNGSPMPVLFANQTRVDFLCPSTEAGTSLEIKAETPSGSTAVGRTVMATARPQLLLAPDLGTKQAYVTIADTDRIGTIREYHGVGEPAQLGDVVSFRATGLGIADSYAGSLFVKVDGVDAQVESVTAAPDTAGVFIIQVRIPAAASRGSKVPVFLELAAPDGQRYSSNTATIAIE